VCNTPPIGARWRVSSRSNGTACVEVADAETAILVRDTKNRRQEVLSFSFAAWSDFIKTVQAESIILK
jgi:hypothetical protein